MNLPSGETTAVVIKLFVRVLRLTELYIFLPVTTPEMVVAYMHIAARANENVKINLFIN